MIRALQRFSRIRKYSTKLGEVSESEYFKQRQAEVDSFTTNAYPDHFKPSLSLQDFVAKFSHLPAGARLKDEPIRVAGRIMSKRESSRKLSFYDIGDGTNRTQLMASQEHFGDKDFFPKRGDIIGVEGFPGRSQKGELSVIPTALHLLSPCLRPLPLQLQNPEVRHSQRYLDLLVNPSSLEIAKRRALVLKGLRRFFEEKGYLEVETPLLQRTAGGAAAKPFTTTQTAGNIPLFLRIAPELFLKQLIIGGIPKVFELGKQFRNEGIDKTHNPEFTSLEAYAAYQNYEDMMSLTEDLFAFLWEDVLGQPNMDINGHIFPVTTRFHRLKFVDTISEKAGEELSSFDEEFLLAYCRRHQVPISEPFTAARLLDQLSGFYVEPLCIEPTFIIDHPRVLSPLAKPHPDRPDLVQRFELFINGVEYVNAYSELNDPALQRRNFEEQSKAKLAGDQEAQSTDLEFCAALEYGLPPTAGWGVGVDRLVMLMTNQTAIREVLLFPLMKTKIQ